MQFWNELEGRSIHGRHPLRRLVRSEGRSAWFESEAGDPAGSPATISLIEALTDADEVTERLLAAQSLQQMNLVSIRNVGQVTLDNTLFVYAVMDHIEQSLAEVLQSQSLSVEQGREVAEALVAGLTAIHQQGMSHGHVEAASVLATEHGVQLRSDCLQLSPAGQVEDVAGIGVTLFHAFTQRKELTATDAQINRIPAPFAEIVRNTFSRRWTLGQVANALKPAHGVPAMAAAPAAPVTPAPAPAPEPAPVAPRPAEIPAARLEPLPPRTDLSEPQPREPIADGEPRRPLGVYAGLAVVLVILGWLGWSAVKPHPAAAPASEPAPQAVAPAPPTAAPAPPAKPSPAAVAGGKRPAPVASQSKGRAVWRVVAYTYKYEKPADEMVEKLKKEHPNLNVAVFSPGGRANDYLISLGGAMTHDEAVRMLGKARSMGLPADTFVRNFSE
jgi:hypothetical protein